jgi:hypothetical protein
MYHSIEDDLIAAEIYYKPISRRRQLIEAIVGALVIAAFVAFMIWFATL